uniref:thymidine kinase n=1 Tax=viral metagenome TaxID=1070528 RepID=A0A6C0H6W1_9ZZZZ
MLTNKAGCLRLYLGCMYSGKSTALLNEISRYFVLTKDIVVINHTLDQDRQHNQTGKSDEFLLQTHDNKGHTALKLTRLKDLIDNPDLRELYRTARVIVIDEAQFFPDLLSFMQEQLVQPKTFIVGGLSGDYNMNPIGQIINLVPLADEIIKLDAYCVYCSEYTIASFSKRLVSSEQQILVGKQDVYLPVCRYHHLNK